jgi:large subunit ribosomal protein L14e
MVFQKFIEIGGVVFSEKHQKPAAIVNVIGLNRLLVDDGNCGRFEVNCRNIRLTDLKIKISHGARPGTVKKAWAAADMSAAFAGTDLAQCMAKKATRANLTDFERYKVMRLRQARNRLINQELGKMKKQK